MKIDFKQIYHEVFNVMLKCIFASMFVALAFGYINLIFEHHFLNKEDILIVLFSTLYACICSDILRAWLKKCKTFFQKSMLIIIGILVSFILLFSLLYIGFILFSW